MSYFNDFLDEELRSILSIPVRIGLWISHVDDIEGTAHDEEKERMALEKTLKTIFKKTHESAFSNDVVEEALRRKDLWPAWEKSAQNVLDDLPKVLFMIKDRLPADSAAGFARAMFYLARAVAQAASELGGEDDLSQEVMGGGLISKIKDMFVVKTDLKMPENVSEKEKAALQKLRQVLKG